MKKKYLFITLILLINCYVFSQENAYSSFDASLKNSIKFNKFLINPAFSFARESSPTITLVNRRQWVKFENAPELYFANYLGSINYNSRFGIGVYQQNVGLLKNFGGVLNYAYNIQVGLESNLTFGLNTYIYNSTFDFGNIITVEAEPLLLNQKANSLVGIKPGINLGTEMFDFGVSVNNLVLYNVTTSEMVNDNQENSYLGYVMYTGYVNSYRGLLEDAKFSSLFLVEKQKDATALSANLLLDIPNKAWAKGGYNTLYGFSAGVGITLSEKFSFGYTYDLGLGDVSQLGSSHEFLLSYRFEDYEESNRYYQSVSNKKSAKKKAPLAPKKSQQEVAKEKADQLALAKAERERKAAEAAEKAKNNKLALEEVARKKAEADKVKVVSNSQTEKDRLAAEEAARNKAAANAKTQADRANAEAAAKAQAEKDRLAAAEAARNKAAADAKSQADRANAEAAAKAQAEKDRLAAAEAARNKAAADAKSQADRANAEAAAKAQAEKDRLAAAVDAARNKAAADAKTQADRANAEAAAKAQAEKDRLAAAEAARNKAAADAKTQADRANAEAAAKAQAEKDRLAGEEAARNKAAADAKTQADKARAEAAAKAQAEKDRLAAAEAARNKAAADAKTQADRANAEAAAKAQAEKDRLASEEAARNKAAAGAKTQADKARAEAAAKAQAEKDRLAAEAAALKKLTNDESNRAVEAYRKDIEIKTKASDKLTKSLDSIVKARDLDLKEYLLENTLNADGTARAARKFVSTSEANAQLQSLKSKISSNKVEFDKLIRDFETTNNQRVKDLKAKGISDLDAKPINDSYLKTLNDLKQKRETFNRLEIEADLKIQKIKDEKEAERLRRIKKAEFDSEKDRNLKDQQILENLKKNQSVTNNGNTNAVKNEQAATNTNSVMDIPIIKKLTDVSSGYYLVLETFRNIEDTKTYLTTVLKAGGSNVNFFYNLHNSTYYVYTARQDTMSDANQALKVKGTKTYNKNMFIVKVE